MNRSSQPVAFRRSFVRRAFPYAALLALSGMLALFVGELVLRLVPIPGITYRSYYYDAATGGKHYPHTTLMFLGADGVRIHRHVNAWGFADVEHRTSPAPGTLRIGFFGDSYTEATQVPLESTFVRVVERDLNAHIDRLAVAVNHRGEPVTRVETFAFGISGRGTLQSYLECKNWMRALDLDAVVYAFVENDPADQIRRLKGKDIQPYPVLAADSFVVDDSFKDRYGYKTSWWHRAQQRIKSHSLVVSTIEVRLKLFKSYTVSSGPSRRLIAPGERGEAGAPMAPSSWPPELVPEGWELVERVVDRWKRDVEAQGRQFVIARVPQGNDVLDIPLEEQDTWAPRLYDYCERRGITLVDPTPCFAARVRAGETMYDDHFTPAGHRAFAEAFTGFLLAREAFRPEPSSPAAAVSQ